MTPEFKARRLQMIKESHARILAKLNKEPEIEETDEAVSSNFDTVEEMEGMVSSNGESIDADY